MISAAARTILCSRTYQVARAEIGDIIRRLTALGNEHAWQPQISARTPRSCAGRVDPCVRRTSRLFTAGYSTFNQRRLQLRRQGHLHLDAPQTSLSIHSFEIDSVGGGWVQSPGSDYRITLDGLASRDFGLDADPGIAVVDTLLTEYDLAVSMAPAGDRSLIGVVFRYLDRENFLAAGHDGKRAGLLEVVNGQVKVVDQRSFEAAAGVPDRWTVRVRRDSIQVDINGITSLQAESSRFSNSTLAGLAFNALHSTSFREFTVTSDSEPPDRNRRWCGTHRSSSTHSHPLTQLPCRSTMVRKQRHKERGNPCGESGVLDSGMAVLSAPDTLEAFADQIAIIPSEGDHDREISAEITWIGGTAGLAWDVLDRSNYSIAFWDGNFLVAGRVDAGVFRERGRQRANWDSGQSET